ncbi:hypothetical protein L7F22_005931, partial [Adiantum nelumboides]|nr:hypothetical protein [Adiantum nelumboides]
GRWRLLFFTGKPPGSYRSRVHFGPIPLEYTQKQLEEHEHHPSCSFSKDSQNDIFQDKNIAERQAKVQITMQEARERIGQLVKPRQDDKHSGTHLLERLMQMVENRKCVRNIALTLVSFCKKVHGWRPWRNSLKEIEGKFGSAVLLTFVFLRFVLLLNAILTVLWIVSIVIPFLISPPKSFSWVHFFDIGFKSFFQEAFLTAGWMAILTRIARRLSVSSKILISGSEVTHPFCTLVFGSWDFGISSPEAASRLRKGLRMHFREMLADISAHEKKLLISSTTSKRYKRYLALGMLWPLQIAASVTIIVFLVSEAEKVNRTFKTEYAQSLLLTLLSMIAPLSIPFLVQLEDWNSATSERVVLLKLFSLRLVNVCTLFYRLYMALAQAAHVKAGNQLLACTSHKGCPDGFACCNTNSGKEWVSCTANQGQVCMPGCMENVVAKQLLRLMLTNTFVSVAWDLVYGVICQRVLKAKRQLSIENLVIDIVYLESLVWVGSSFSPVAPTLGLFCNFMVFSYMKFSLRRFYEPMKKPYSASRTSNLTHGLLLLALILCSLPASATLVQKSSGVCGPIAENSSMYKTLSDYIEIMHYRWSCTQLSSFDHILHMVVPIFASGGKI